MIYLYLLPFLLAAIICDLNGRRIPNTLITGGMIMGGAYQWSVCGPSGIGVFLGGIAVPLVTLGALHYFRMIGAGDVKLLMMAGGFFGAAGSLKCVFFSFLAGGVYALFALRKRGLLRRRLQYLARYLGQGPLKSWRPYIGRDEKEGTIYFSIPVLLGSLAVMTGGIL